MVELADTRDLKSRGPLARAGSSPAPGTSESTTEPALRSADGSRVAPLGIARRYRDVLLPGIGGGDFQRRGERAGAHQWGIVSEASRPLEQGESMVVSGMRERSSLGVTAVHDANRTPGFDDMVVDVVAAAPQ